MTAAIYRTSIRHVRRDPLENAFTYRSYSWFVDVDDLPVLPRWLRPLAGFHAKDHLGDPAATIRENVDRFLAANGEKPDGGKVTMLANARVLGQVFNPDQPFLVPRGGRRTARRNRRGPQHLRRTPLLPAAPRRAGARPH